MNKPSPDRPARSAHPLLHLAFFVSGASGLAYQVVWVREFGRVFGGTLASASVITAAFMGGIGLGNLLAGRWADRVGARSPAGPLRAYVWAELGIAALGLGVALTLPALEAVSAGVTSYAVDARGWHFPTDLSVALRYLAALLLVGPPTLLMGATLPLLIRFVLARDLSSAGWRVGALYGVNTLGAGLGALGVDFALIPGLGLLGTQVGAALGNVLAALLVFALLRRERTTASMPPAGSPPAISRPSSLELAAGVAIAVSGFAAMGMEMVWFRYFSMALGQYRPVFSLLLALILVGMWAGAVTSGYLSRRLGHPGWLYVAAQALWVVTATSGLYALDLDALHSPAFRDAWLATAPSWRPGFEAGQLLGLMAGVVLAPALFMGFAYPLANALAQRELQRVGRTAGGLYLFNAGGALAGSLVVGLAAIPALGMQGSAVLCLGLALAAALPVVGVQLRGALPRVWRKERRAAAIAAGVAALALFALVDFARLPEHTLLMQSFRGKYGVGLSRADPSQLVAVSEGPLEAIVIADVDHDGRVLFTNGHRMSGATAVAERYMRAFVHIPLLLQREPARSALVICFGVGNTLHAASLHETLERLEVVDLSEHVLEHAPFFAHANGDVLVDPRVEVFVNDGRQHLRAQETGTYDLITLEPPPIRFAGMANLYSRDFYELVRSRLRAGGALTQWLPVRQVSGEVALSMVRAFVEVFPSAVLLYGEDGELILYGRKGAAPALDPGVVAERLEARDAVRGDLARVGFDSVLDLAGAFLASGESLRRATEGYPPVTDDWPINEYGPVALVESEAPRALFEPETYAAWCPRCDEELPSANAYARLMGGLTRSEVFRAIRPMGGFERERAVVTLTDEEAKHLAEESRFAGWLLSRVKRRAPPGSDGEGR